jgi:hypothetical protein
MAPPSLMPGVVFAGSLDGHLRAYDTRDGKVLWDFDTAQEFHTTNGVQAHGGSRNGAGPTIVSGMVYLNTGYTNAMAGNVPLAVFPRRPLKYQPLSLAIRSAPRLRIFTVRYRVFTLR